MRADPSPSPAAGPTPERLFQMAWSFGVTRVLTSAIELEVFRLVTEGKRTPAAMASALGAPERGLRMLVDALVGLGLLLRPGPAPETPVSMPPDVDLFLVKGKPSYVGDFVVFHSRVIDEHWRGLTNTLRTGTPVRAVDEPVDGVPVWHQLVDALFAVGYRAATQVGEELARLHPGKAIRLLDVAAGSGVWGIGAATANPKVTVTAMDLPETLEHARRWFERTGLAARAQYLAGDLRTTDFGTARFEAATLGHICHSEGAEHTRALLAKVARALVPGGTIVLLEFVPDADRNGPVLPLLFALNMLVNTNEGGTFTFPEYAAWLEAAGFKDVRQVPGAGPSPFIFATRA